VSALNWEINDAMEQDVMERTMKLVSVLALAGGLALFAGTSPAKAFAVPAGTEVRGASPIVEAAGRCGASRHWVAAHRNRHGVRVSGHCSPNRRHR